MSHLCRYCGKPIRKRTARVMIEREPTQYHHPSEFWRYVYIGDKPWPGSIEDCRALTNETVVSVSYGKHDNRGENDPMKVSHFKTWDGEHYVSQWFCTNNCAIAFANLYASRGNATSSYNTAVARLQKKK